LNTYCIVCICTSAAIDTKIIKPKDRAYIIDVFWFPARGIRTTRKEKCIRGLCAIKFFDKIDRIARFSQKKNTFITTLNKIKHGEREERGERREERGERREERGERKEGERREGEG
jgi:hypothetical protein